MQYLTGYTLPMTIHETIKAGIPEALKAKDDAKLRTFRSLSAAMTNEVVAKKRKPDELLTDEEALSVLKRAVNQRKDSIEQFTKGGRQEMADKEAAEIKLIETYLPKAAGEEDIVAGVRAAIAEMTPAPTMKDMGSVMKAAPCCSQESVLKLGFSRLFFFNA